MKALTILAVFLSVFITGCAVNQSSDSNFYTADQANEQLESKLVTILLIMPAKLEVDNSQNAQTAKTAGAVGGALLGAFLGSNHGNAGGGALIGGAAGGIGGSMVSDKKVVEGVSVTYQINDEHFTAIQTGKVCQFKKGSTLLIIDKKGKSRVQPNATCPVETKA